MTNHTHAVRQQQRPVRNALRPQKITGDLPLARSLQTHAWRLRGWAMDCDARRQTDLGERLRNWAQQYLTCSEQARTGTVNQAILAQAIAGESVLWVKMLALQGLERKET